MGVGAVCADGNNGVAMGGNALDDGMVGAIVGANFIVLANRIKTHLRFGGIEGLEGGQIHRFTYDLHLICTFGKVLDNAGKTVMVTEAKVAEKEDAHGSLFTL